MILKSFKRLLGNGRAWFLRAPNIQNTVKAFLKPIDDLYNNGFRIACTPFPTQNKYNNDLEGDLKLFENQFGISNPSADLNERAAHVEAQWGMVGGQGYQYIEKALTSAGLPVKIIENLPIFDFNAASMTQFGNIEYDQTVNGTIVEYGQSGYKLIGNGMLNIAGSTYDPAVLNNCKYAFLVECLSPLTTAQYEIMTDIILRTKPLQEVCLVKT